MAISSGVGKAATTAAKTGKTTTAKVVTPKKPTAAQLAAEKKAAQLSFDNPIGGEATFGSPMMSQDSVTGQWYGTVQQRNQAVQDRIAAENAKPTTPAWSLESDPLYKSALDAGQAQFNYARNAALAEKQTQQLGLSNQRKALDTSATEARRRTAGNYAARGMAGGAAGAYSVAEARANAEQITAQTSLDKQIAALNDNFLSTYGDINAKDAEGKSTYDWTGTLTGQQYKTQAAQAALEAALARYGTV